MLYFCVPLGRMSACFTFGVTRVLIIVIIGILSLWYSFYVFISTESIAYFHSIVTSSYELLMVHCWKEAKNRLLVHMFDVIIDSVQWCNIQNLMDIMIPVILYTVRSVIGRLWIGYLYINCTLDLSILLWTFKCFLVYNIKFPITNNKQGCCT